MKIINVGDVVKIKKGNSKKCYAKVSQARIYDDLFVPCVELQQGQLFNVVRSSEVRWNGKQWIYKGAC